MYDCHEDLTPECGNDSPSFSANRARAETRSCFGACVFGRVYVHGSQCWDVVLVDFPGTLLEMGFLCGLGRRRRTRDVTSK